MTQARLTDNARALLRAIDEIERELAGIWREPFEGYDLKQRLAWGTRQVQAARAYRALLEQL